MISTEDEIPPAGYIGSEQVMRVLADHGRALLERLDSARVFALAMLAGAFITTGGAALGAAGCRGEGAVRLLEGFGFSAGFFFVILSGAVLFTEATVALPAVLLGDRRQVLRVLRFWALAWLGNLVGALLIGWLVSIAIDLTPTVEQLLRHVVDTKSAAMHHGAGAWWSVVVSGVLANWLVGMAAFFATMGRTIIGKYVPVMLAVTAFVSAGFQHSPANMGFFSLYSAFVGELDWGAVLVWSLAPAGLGNIIGGGIAVAVLLSWIMRASNQHPAWRVAGCPAGPGERCEVAHLGNIMRKPSKGTSGLGDWVPGVYPISTHGGRMSRIPAHTLDNAPDQSRDTLAGLAKKVGKVLNIHAGMAHSPVVMAAHKGIGDAIASHGTLDARTRETIALAVANEDGCHYCESAHTLSGKAAGLTVEQTLAIRSDTIDFDDKLAAIAAVVREAAGNTGTVSDVTWKQALEAGWTEQELTETFAHLAANLFTNYFNHYAETDLDLPEAPALAS